jgi:colanic acid biosynthesis glycosyl transferase WcaI
VRILFLNQTFHPDVVATAQYASDLAGVMADRGHEVTVMCSRRAYDNPRELLPKNEVWRGVSIRRISCLGLGKSARWRRATDFASFLLNCAGHLTLLGRFDVVIGMTSPPLISWLGALFTRIKGGRFVSWVMDLNPDEALAAGWLREGSWTTALLQWILLDSLRGSALVIVLDRFMADRIERKGIDAGRIAVLPPWSLDEAVRYDEEGRERFRRQHGLDGKFVVMYSGNHTPCHPLATLLQAAKALRDRPDIAFCFAGGGSELETVRRFAAAHAMANIVVVPYQPLTALSASLSAADLHAVVMGNAFVGIVHPSKVYNVRALGLPYLYIGPKESHISELTPTHTAAHGDVDAVARHIRCAAATRSTAVVAHDGEFARSRLVGRFVGMLEEIAGGQRDPALTLREQSPHF